MTTTPLTLTPAGGPQYSVVSSKLLHLYQGAWVLDLELAAASFKAFGMPSGKVVVVDGGVPMTGTIDPSASGSFGPTARARVIGGGGGWDRTVPRQAWHFDNGVSSTTVYQATAAAVGEVVKDLTPRLFDIDFVRVEGAASAVFRDNLWWVDTTGITNVGPRPPAAADASLVIRDWDPVAQKITFSCNTLLLPGTTLSDPRFAGGVGPTLYDVEQVFDGRGSIGWAWTSPKPVSSLLGDLKAAVLYWTRAALLRSYRYRLVQYEGPGPDGPPSRMALQAVTPTAGVPDLVPITPWGGLAGAVATLSPSQEVLVVFENADPTLPRIVDYSLAGLPTSSTIDAQEELNLGVEALAVKLGGGGAALTPAPYSSALLTALATFATSCSGSTTDPVLKAAALALITALGLLPPGATLITKAS